jgi:hypothetical protein
MWDKLLRYLIYISDVYLIYSFRWAISVVFTFLNFLSCRIFTFKQISSLEKSLKLSEPRQEATKDVRAKDT